MMSEMKLESMGEKEQAKGITSNNTRKDNLFNNREHPDSAAS